MNRRTFIKKMTTSLLTLFGLGGGTYFYAREIEPSMLKIQKETIQSINLPPAFDQFTIVQFSDTHIGFHYTLEQLKQLVQQINNQNPDIVVFTGDLVDMPDTYTWNNELINILTSIQAKYGKFWIYGNHDHGGYGTDIVKKTMEKAGFQLLQNNHVLVTRNEQSIAIAGLDDVMLGKPDISTALSTLDAELFTVLLVHEPDYADIAKHYPVNVQLSGHSHGGQVQIPLLGYVYTPTYAEKYVEGKYIVGTNPLQLFVSRGIGTTRLPYRFLCKPEIAIYRLSTKAT